MIAIYTYSVYELHKGHINQAWPIKRFQLYDYMITRPIWQAKVECVEPDDQLIFQPKFGVCEFNTFQFETSLNFDIKGRGVPERKLQDNNNGIAIIGDSQAMGFGVNDADTFANHIQKQVAQPVYNLAVSGYATRREFERFFRSGLSSKVDTIILQYCSNDLDENDKKLDEAHYLQAKIEHFSKIEESIKINKIIAGEGRNLSLSDYKIVLSKLFNLNLEKIYFAIVEPLNAAMSFFNRPLIPDYFNETARSIDFNPHYKNIIDILYENKDLIKDKRIIVTYSNGYGARFFNFPQGKIDGELDISFFDPGMDRNDYYTLDDHLTPKGHMKFSKKIIEYLNNRNHQ